MSKILLLSLQSGIRKAALLLFCFGLMSVNAQQGRVKGIVRDKLTGETIPGATIFQLSSQKSKLADREGVFAVDVNTVDSTQVVITASGFKQDTNFLPTSGTKVFYLQPESHSLGEVVITGTMRSVLRSASPVPVEVYTPKFFLKNPTPSIFDALQLVNGVRPQLNCNVCNTGDIHINGLEGPYTMILIDGMPIVSSLASVYGLSGIPNSLVERIEIVKGPASSLYGSEAIGGLINVITKNPLKAPLLALDISTSGWREINADVAMKYKPGKQLTALLGISYFNYSNPQDRNNDHFTDVTLQKRISIFNKFSWKRPEEKPANLAIRYIYEDRWGGEMNWKKQFRGSDSVYGETIYTSRFELTGNYQLPFSVPLTFSYSLNSHVQQSAYGKTIFNAKQQVAFGQLTWEKSMGNHNLLAGLVSRYTWYDDNTPATRDTAIGGNVPEKILLPGIFIQEEFEINAKQTLLGGIRWDHDKRHGNIFTPRVAWKYAFINNDLVRINAGTGFRVVHIFTEDHAALTGARDVIIASELKPEKSFNVNINYLKKIQTTSGWMSMELSAWYTYFTNRILPDYLTNPNQIIYRNLDGYAVSQGASINVEAGFTNSLKLTAGGTLMNVYIHSINANGKIENQQQLLTEKWSATWTLSYFLRPLAISIDYTGNIYGRMRLPLLSAYDPRAPFSPVWSIQNIQLTKKIRGGIEFYAGLKNLLNWTPAKHAAFLIARADDPFDKQVSYDVNGQVIATANNPYALTFDPNYVYGPNQGRRVFAGARLNLK